MRPVFFSPGALTSSASLLCNSRVFGEVVRTLRRGASTPRMEYDKGKIERHKVEIQEILGALNAPDSPPTGSNCVGQCTPQSLSTGTVATSNSKSGRNGPRRWSCVGC